MTPASDGSGREGPPTVVGLVGASGSGKTELACRLIRFLSRRGERSAFVKHTHHELDGNAGGDTNRALEAGAERSYLISGDRALQFDGAGEDGKSAPIPDLFAIPADVVVVEGFRERNDWRKILVETRREDDRRASTRYDAVVGPAAHGVPHFSPDDLEGIARFFGVLR